MKVNELIEHYTHQSLPEIEKELTKEFILWLDETRPKEVFLSDLYNNVFNQKYKKNEILHITQRFIMGRYEFFKIKFTYKGCIDVSIAEFNKVKSQSFYIDPETKSKISIEDFDKNTFYSFLVNNEIWNN